MADLTSLSRGVMQTEMQAFKAIGEPGITHPEQPLAMITIEPHGGLDVLVKIQPMAIALAASRHLTSLMIHR
jgi:hypothetical protein